MKRFTLLLTSLLLAALLLAACGGEETSTSVPNTNVPPTEEPTSTSEPTATAADTAGTPDLTTTPNVPVTGEESPNRLTNLMDYDVWNQNGEQIGEVDDMVLDFDNSNIAYVIVGTGGFLEIGEKEVLVPWDMMQVQTAAENAFLFTGDQEFFKNAPDWDVSSLLPEMGQPAEDWDADVRNFWATGVAPDASGAGDTAAGTETPAGTATEAVAVATATLAMDNPGVGQGRAMQGVMLASELLGSTIRVYTSAGPGVSEGTAAPDATAMPLATATGSGTGTDTATATADGTGTGLGPAPADTMDLTVEDAIVDPDTGEIRYLVVDGDFPDGDRLIPVPFSLLRWDATNQGFSLGVTTAGLQNAPVFADGQYPDFTTDDWDNELASFWDNLDAGWLIATPAP